MNQALTWYQEQGNAGEAARVAVNLADAIVNAAEPQYAAGLLLLKANDPLRGEPYLRRAVALDGDKVEYRLSLAQSQFMQGLIPDCIATLEAALQKHPEETRVKYWLDSVRQAAAR